MSRVRTFFLREGAECLSRIREEVAGEMPMDTAAVYRAIRRFRGSAQMARFGEVADRAWVLEQRLRELPVRRSEEGGTSAMDEALGREVRNVLESLESDMEAVREGRLEAESRTEAGMQEQQTGEGQGTGVVPVEAIEYRGEAALDRALELRAPLERAIVSDEPAGPILEELFDLIHLGLK